MVPIILGYIILMVSLACCFIRIHNLEEQLSRMLGRRIESTGQEICEGCRKKVSRSQVITRKGCVYCYPMKDYVVKGGRVVKPGIIKGED